jgi:hypothetical protein
MTGIVWASQPRHTAQVGRGLEGLSAVAGVSPVRKDLERLWERSAASGDDGPGLLFRLYCRLCGVNDEDDAEG